MAFTIDTAHTLPEALRHRAPDGSYMWAYDALEKARLPFLEEMYFEQANDDLAHEFLRNVTKPTGTLTALETGAPFETSKDRAIREQLCRIESNMRVAVATLEKAHKPSEFYREKETRHLLGLTKTMHETIFSKNSRGDMGTNPLDINGLGVRYGKLGDNVVGLGAASGTDLASAWLIKHGPDGFFGLYPRSTGKGVRVSEYGEQVVYDANNNPFKAVMTNFCVEFGIGIMDDACVQRICNIASSGNNSFFQDGTTVQKGEYALIDAIERLPGGNADNAAIYVGPKLMAQFRKRLNDKGNLYFTMQNVWGRPMLHFMDVPVIRVDTLVNNESPLTA